ncbi:hypothetical protein K488DRAFT_67019, partial [Vararia minispora EC-137]
QYITHSVQLLSDKAAHIHNFAGGKLPRKDQDDYDDYCITMLTLFKPWRLGKDLKQVESL